MRQPFLSVHRLFPFNCEFPWCFLDIRSSCPPSPLYKTIKQLSFKNVSDKRIVTDELSCPNSFDFLFLIFAAWAYSFSDLQQSSMCHLLCPSWCHFSPKPHYHFLVQGLFTIAWGPWGSFSIYLFIILFLVFSFAACDFLYQ